MSEDKVEEVGRSVPDGLLPTVEPVPVSPLRAAIPSATDRCANCAYSTPIGARGMCCWRYPPTIHRRWFKLVELYPSVLSSAVCGEHRKASAIEARRAETQGGSVADESATRQGDAQ